MGDEFDRTYNATKRRYLDEIGIPVPAAPDAPGSEEDSPLRPAPPQRPAAPIAIAGASPQDSPDVFVPPYLLKHRYCTSPVASPPSSPGRAV